MIPRGGSARPRERIPGRHRHVELDPVQRTKVAIEIARSSLLTILNIRGVKESVTAILPIFAIFVVTHAVLLSSRSAGTWATSAQVAHRRGELHHTVASARRFGALALFVRAYSLGGGTYTGIEAVSNGVPIMREPKVRTAKRTMVLMATSLSITAGGIILAYLLVHVAPDERTKTMNAILLDRVAGAWRIGGWNAGTGSCSSRSAARRGCSSSRRRPASSTGRASWPTWRSTRGCRTASPRCPSA
jgi:hypothetical protein